MSSRPLFEVDDVRQIPAEELGDPTDPSVYFEIDVGLRRSGLCVVPLEEALLAEPPVEAAVAARLSEMAESSSIAIVLIDLLHRDPPRVSLSSPIKTPPES